MRATYRPRILYPDRSRSLFGLDPPRHGSGSDRQQPELARIAAAASVTAAAGIAAAARVAAAPSIPAAPFLLLVFERVANLFVVDVADRLTPDNRHGMCSACRETSVIVSRIAIAR